MSDLSHLWYSKMSKSFSNHISTKPLILFIFRRKRKERLELYEAAQGPDEALYGINHFDLQRFRVDFCEGDDNQWNWRRRLWYPIEVQIARLTNIGFALHIALDNLSQLRQAGLIISTVDSCGLPIAFLKWLGLISTPTIYISQGLSDRFEHLPPYAILRKFVQLVYCQLLQAVEHITVLGEGAIEPVVRVFGIERSLVSCIPFGIDITFWIPAASEEVGNYILSVGSDPARDYPTLVNAITKESLKIVTRLPVINENLNSLIEVSSEFTDLELRILYQRARFVVTTLRDVAQPSGQTATLQAMACGKAVILSRTQGLWDSAYMKHLENCYLIDPGDVGAMQRAIRHLWNYPDEAARLGKNARSTVEERYSSSYFAFQLENQINKVLYNAHPSN